ncbi:lamin tail domain-containing protein [Streptomyces sp. LP11]|uniref:Lamin tail domain-containing protein n=1 Tax=Streptomyces pyxinicus TaxID=2970331 RepID=A0ABT2B8Y3_9ACTN|nr:lamin tail domain-containing protein [Streptomyces sp. LP11]MCS0604969.1 lamin tail domain-containing protein [Streptomyces sp. LP11]
MTVSASVRRITAVTAVTAAALGAVALPAAAADHHPTPHSRQGVVRISAAHVHAPGRDDRNVTLAKEWVAVTNDARRPVDLNHWTLTDRSGHTYTFHHYRLGARSTVRVHTGVGRDTRKDLFQDRRRSVWDATDTATLRDDHGRVVDDASWGRGRGHRHH